MDELEDRYYRSLKNRDSMYYSGAQITPYIWHFTTHRGGAGSMQPPGKQDGYTRECLKGIDYHARNFMISMVGTKFNSNTTLMDANWAGAKMAAWNTGITCLWLEGQPQQALDRRHSQRVDDRQRRQCLHR